MVKHPEHVAVADSKVRPFTANALPDNDLIYREIKNRWEGEKSMKI
ncbi:MAG: hypothetical protein K6E78_03575 [Treponema sp.]|nr:hypothetical protein [Treponema sp.]